MPGASVLLRKAFWRCSGKPGLPIHDNLTQQHATQLACAYAFGRQVIRSGGPAPATAAQRPGTLRRQSAIRRTDKVVRLGPGEGGHPVRVFPLHQRVPHVPLASRGDQPEIQFANSGKPPRKPHRFCDILIQKTEAVVPLRRAGGSRLMDASLSGCVASAFMQPASCGQLHRRKGNSRKCIGHPPGRCQTPPETGSLLSAIPPLRSAVCG